jgi:nitroimidazol reductase NimA-like FMN-containing flavoprotein (pyridoxamine 5'-phosphate oxidase superfamily)
MADRSGAPSERVRVRRLHERGAYDRATIDAILDAQPVAHVGYVIDGAPFVTPTLQWREGDHVYWHGSAASRMLERCDGAEVCVTVTLVDGLVLARSAFNHSVNYRSVMLLGRARLVTDPAEKEARLRRFVDALFPGRWDQLRPATVQEMKATSVLGLAIDEASAKIRQGPPKDEAEDYVLPIWAGVIPLRTEVLAPVDDPKLAPGIPVPAHVRDFRTG